jgi:hypothetical protein
MKFVCMKCEGFMLFQDVQVPGEQSLGVTFGCPTCGAKIAMVTNPGETAMVNALGVKIGGRTVPAAPMEFTRENLQSQAAPPATPSPTQQQEMLAQETAAASSSGKCPFSSMIAQMQGGGEAASTSTEALTWAADAQERLERVPSFMRPMIQMGVENYARKNGIAVITPAVMDESKNDPGDVIWSADAEARLENIPSFIRPMARKEIERVAKERGLAEVSAALMEESKSKFLGMGY